nr:hypothetical protein [Tanacetum cinerariifolium]
MVNTRTDAELAAAVRNALQTLLPQIRQRFAMSSVLVLDRRVLVEIIHRSLFILGLNALISKSPVHLRRRQLSWMQRIRSLTWRRSLMSWVVRMHSRLDWLCTSLRVMHLLGGRPISKPKPIAPVDAENWISHMENIFDVMGCSQQSRGPSEGYSYPVCTTYGRRHPGECRRAAGTCFKCGQAGQLQKDCKKNTTARTSGQADKKLGASGRVFTITEGHAANTS